jgi:hypothetical protein
MVNENLLSALKDVLTKNSQKVNKAITAAGAECVCFLFYHSNSPDFCKKLANGFELKERIKDLLIDFNVIFGLTLRWLNKRLT